MEKIPLDPGPGPSDKAWYEYFKTHDPQPRAVVDVVQRLHKAKRIDDLINCINGALIHGRSQAWMYTVLAMAMEQAGRPREEVERVLLSNIDFSAINVDNLLVSGAVLTKHGAKSIALGIYRQASLVDPARIEPYIMALGLADEVDDPEAASWVVSGILQRAWGRDHETYHKNAKIVAANLEARLRKLGNSAAADRLAQEVAEASKVDLRVELTWSGKGDLDLLVEEPSGALCSSDNPTTASGGVFVHDGMGGDKDSYDAYVCPRGMPGDYRVIVRHISGDVVGKMAVLKVTRYGGSSQQIQDEFVVKLAEKDKIVRVTLQNGRLNDATTVTLLDFSRGDLGSGKQLRRQEMFQRHIDEKIASGQLFRRRERPVANSTAIPGYQPLISVVSEGVMMSALAVVTADRRYVRLSMNPQFSAISDIATFTFFHSGGNGNGGNGAGGGNVGGR